MMMWQPIETAPKDGSSILLATPKGRIADGFWSPVYGVWSWPYVMVEPTRWIPKPDLPGAQNGASEQDESVRKSWARFSNELHRSPDATYPGMSEAFEQHFSQSFTDREWRAEASTWAAAWKAAKRHCAQPAQSVPKGFALVNATHFLAVLDREDWRTVKNRAELRAMLAAAPKPEGE